VTSREFLKVRPVKDVQDFIAALEPLGTEVISLENAHGRVVAETVIARDPVPHFRRATMDGYAVRSRDVFGASESLPAFLSIVGSVEMGKPSACTVGTNEACAIPTGGALPDGADAVVMVEHTERLDETTIEVYKPVAPGENVLGVGDDIPEGEQILQPGRALKPQDLGVLAAVGVTEVEVYKRPKVAIISTGDEIVPSKTPSPLPPGLIRDINTHVLASMVSEAGAVVGRKELIKDDPDALIDISRKCLEDHDVVLLSGGSSVGSRDYTLDVLEQLPDAEVLVHGVAMRPGKPTILGRSGKRYVWGLPGQPSSASMVMVAMVCPFLRALQGERPTFPYAAGTIIGRLCKPIPSVHGREDYIPVRVLDEDQVEPIFGKSGMIKTLAMADGYIIVPEHAEGMDTGEEVKVYLF